MFKSDIPHVPGIQKGLAWCSVIKLAFSIMCHTPCVNLTCMVGYKLCSLRPDQINLSLLGFSELEIGPIE